MMRPTTSLLAGLLLLCASVTADPIWPAPTDELEEIMYQLQGFRARLFSDTISPCSNEASGPGRQNAAEWLRVGFHDMATANVYFGTGGLDGSLQFELNNGENTGPGHNTTLKFLANYLSSRSSLADLIAAGVYASVRSCGGPIVPVRGGRIDATEAGSPGVPQPQNAISLFRNQFDRMGFNPIEMIQVTACGHTLGGVHSTEFPDIVPPGSTPNGEIGLDSTVASFDNKVITEYLSNTTLNPLVVGPAVALKKNSDFVVNNSDGNVTVKAMADAAVFQNTCKVVLQKMIDVVPAGVVLTDPIIPYTVKPVNIQLTLNSPGTSLLMTGYIRVRKNGLPADISNVRLTYKDRNGGNNCGACSATLTVGGTATGFDDQFAFFPVSTNMDAATGISSFTVTINFSNGASQTFNNNGKAYPISDAVLLQKPQSCLLQGSGALTVKALVRNDRTALPVNLGLSYLVPRPPSRNGNPVPTLTNATVAMTKGDCVGQYTFYTASYTVPGGLSYNSKLDIISGSGADVVSDSFNAASELAGSCVPFTGGAACGSASTSSTSTSTSTSSTRISTTSSTTSTYSSVSPTASLGHKAKIGGYNLVSCWTEGSGARALKGAAFASDLMTLESCMQSCAGFAYWGTEYGRECYCGNSLDSTSSAAPLSECNMICAGDSKEYCGAGNRLELYLTTASQLPSSTRSSTSASRSTTIATSSTKSSTTTSTTSKTSTSVVPTGTLGVKATVGKYSFVGCQTEGSGVRALSAKTYASDDMTLESCASFCQAFKFFGTEYGRECYCGDSLAASSTVASLADCNMVCAGSAIEYCGAGNRLELYRVASTSSSTPLTSTTSSSSASVSSTKTSTTSSTTSKPSSTTAQSSPKPTLTSALTTSSIPSSTSTTTPTPLTLSHKPTIPPYTLLGCYTEPPTSRALTGPSMTNISLSLTSCATFCTGHAYFGTEYSSECYCGDTLSALSLPAPLSDCNMPCSGSPYEYCGAGNRLEVYFSNVTESKPDITTSTGEKWAWKGCYTEASNGRALMGDSWASDDMTLEKCAGFCKGGGWLFAGAEYGRECYCGNEFGGGSVMTGDAGECGMGCAGDRGELCGAGGRLSVYSKV